MALAVVSMVTNEALLRRPTAQTSSKMESFSENLDLTEEEEILYFNFTPEEKETMEEKTVICVHRSKEEQRQYVFVNQMRVMDREQYFLF